MDKLLLSTSLSAHLKAVSAGSVMLSVASAMILSGCSLDPKATSTVSPAASDTVTIQRVEERLGATIPNNAAVKIVSTARSSVAMTGPDETYSVTVEGTEIAVGAFVAQVAPPATRRVTVESRCSASTVALDEPSEDAVEQSQARNIVTNLDRANRVERCAPIDVLFLPDSPGKGVAAIYHQGALAIIAMNMGT